MTNEELDCVMTGVALLSRHEYWSKELWRTREATKEKHKNDDRANVENAYMAHRLLFHGVYTTPCGSVWAHNVERKTEEEKKQWVEEYYSDYNDIFKDYWDWQWEQH